MPVQIIKKYKLQSLLFISLTLTFASVAYITGEYMRTVQTRTLEDSFTKHSQKTFSMLFATSLDAVLSEDQPVLETIVAQSIELDPEIHALSIVNEFNQELAGSAPDSKSACQQNMGLYDYSFHHYCDNGDAGCNAPGDRTDTSHSLQAG